MKDLSMYPAFSTQTSCAGKSQKDAELSSSSRIDFFGYCNELFPRMRTSAEPNCTSPEEQVQITSRCPISSRQLNPIRGSSDFSCPQPAITNRAIGKSQRKNLFRFVFMVFVFIEEHDPDGKKNSTNRC